MSLQLDALHHKVYRAMLHNGTIFGTLFAGRMCVVSRLCLVVGSYFG
jgi:hypothetical protein